MAYLSTILEHCDPQYNHNQISMVIADGLASIWHQGICNHHDGVARSLCIRSAQLNDLSKWSLFCGVYLDYSMLVRARHTAGSCASQPRAKVCGPWNRFISPWQNGRYFAENIFKCIFVNAFSRAGLAVWNVFMTRRVINCHKLCPKQVYNASFRQFRNVQDNGEYKRTIKAIFCNSAPCLTYILCVQMVTSQTIIQYLIDTSWIHAY